MLTETQIRAHERHKKFHADIAAKAAALNKPNPVTQAVAMPQTPPAPPSTSGRIDALERQVADLQEALSAQGALISRLFKESISDTPRLSEITEAVCAHYSISEIEITSQRKKLVTTRPRMIAYYLARKLTGLSLPQIGAKLGGRDHTSVLNGANKIAKEIQSDELLRDDCDLLELKIAEKVLNRETPRGRQVVHKLPVLA